MEEETNIREHRDRYTHMLIRDLPLSIAVCPNVGTKPKDSNKHGTATSIRLNDEAIAGGLARLWFVRPMMDKSVERLFALGVNRRASCEHEIALHLRKSKTEPRLACDEIVAVTIFGSSSSRLKVLGVLGIGLSLQ
jgi:hypothetical protein